MTGWIEDSWMSTSASAFSLSWRLRSCSFPETQRGIHEIMRGKKEINSILVLWPMLYGLNHWVFLVKRLGTIIMASLFFRWENLGSERLSHLHKDTQLAAEEPEGGWGLPAPVSGLLRCSLFCSRCGWKATQVTDLWETWLWEQGANITWNRGRMLSVSWLKPS